MNRRDLIACGMLSSGLMIPTEAAPPKSPPGGKKDPRGFRLEPERALDADARDYLGTPASEATMRKALKYMAHHQNPDGSWGDSDYNADVAVAALSLLAFQSAGHQPDRGPHGKLLRSGADYLVKCCNRSGLIHDAKRGPNRPMYSHGFSTLALAELYGMTRNAELRDPLERAVELILLTQNGEGGWRYFPRVDDADISVVICQIMALRAADNAGVRVPKETTEKAIGYVKRCANNADGGFSYMPTQRGSGQARTGAGVLSLIVMGQRDCEEVKNGLEYLMAHPPSGNQQWVFYGIYYCTQAMYQAGGKYWQFWFPKVAKYLQATQRPEGNWYDSPGYAYATAMGILALNVPSGLLPIYQK